MKHRVTRTLYSYWTKLRGDRTAPDRREIDPSDIRHILGDTFILEVQGDGNYQFRLAGTRICASFGRELKGRNLLDLFEGHDRDSIAAMLAAIVEDGAAAVVGTNGFNNRKQTVPFELMFLPLKHQGNEHSRILGCFTATEDPYWLGIHPVSKQEVASLRIIWPDERPAFMTRSMTMPVDNQNQPVMALGETAQASMGARSNSHMPSGPRIGNGGNSGVQMDSGNMAFDRANRGSRPPSWSMPTHQRPTVTAAMESGRKVGHLTVIDGGKDRA